MNIESTKFIVTSGIQLFLGVGAWFFGWRIAHSQIHNQRADIRIKLFDQRYSVYKAFKEFIAHCTVNDTYTDSAISKFRNETDKIEFLFGSEIRKYHREVFANALALKCLSEGLPCENQPVVGVPVGYFKGSTVLTDVPSIRKWFYEQHRGDMYRYFVPYLDYGSAGVDLAEITMNPPDLPDPPLVRTRRPLKNENQG